MIAKIRINSRTATVTPAMIGKDELLLEGDFGDSRGRRGGGGGENTPGGGESRVPLGVGAVGVGNGGAFGGGVSGSGSGSGGVGGVESDPGAVAAIETRNSCSSEQLAAGMRN
nr:hypothetical protein Iba_chr02cCG5670 [Ipomoea batatas]